MAFDVSAIRRQFPILSGAPGGIPLTYLDTAATAQKPESVLAAMDTFYRTANANVHRGIFPLAERATELYEGARTTVQKFIGAASSSEIVFTKNATEAINLVANGWAMSHCGAGDEIVLSALEHHSNIVPWMHVAEATGALLRWLDMDESGIPKMDHLETLLSSGRVKLVAMTGLSNVTGGHPHTATCIRLAHAAGAKVLIDASQLAAHFPVDVQDIAQKTDFLVFSGHKVYGPTGIGVLYAQYDTLQDMRPMLGGGGMIQDITKEGYTAADVPHRFEAGTPPVAEAVGLAAAIEWLSAIPVKEREAHEHALTTRAIETLRDVPGLRILGSGDPVTTYGCISMTIDGAHPHDLAQLLGDEGICLRAGHHCARLIHRFFGIDASLRLSIGLYNTIEDIERIAPALQRALQKLR